MRFCSALLLNIFLINGTCLTLADFNAKEGQAIAKCLERFGGPTLDNVQRLQRFKDWSDTYEEIPCFSHCYLSKMFDFYNETTGFNETNVIKEFGPVIYEACKTKLFGGLDQCNVAYSGFHCMVNLETDPFVILESMKDLHSEAKLAMKDCLLKFEKPERERFVDYSDYPVKEPLPCYTRCFVERLQLFNHRLRTWNTEAMRKRLGFPDEKGDISACQAMGKGRTRNVCAWMYREFVCYLMSRDAKNIENQL